jgi:hypothetical protein
MFYIDLRKPPEGATKGRTRAENLENMANPGRQTQVLGVGSLSGKVTGKKGLLPSKARPVDGLPRVGRQRQLLCVLWIFINERHSRLTNSDQTVSAYFLINGLMSWIGRGLCEYATSQLIAAFLLLKLTNRLRPPIRNFSIRSDSANRIRLPAVGDGKVP